MKSKSTPGSTQSWALIERERTAEIMADIARQKAARKYGPDATPARPAIGGEAEMRLAGAVNIAKLPELLRKQ